jgi:Potential Queuosine, Q, salvage protein family
MRSYTHALMLTELTAITERARHVMLDREQLGRVAGVMRSRTHVGDIPVRQDSPHLEPPELLQFYLVAGAHNFLIWQRDEAGAVQPWSVYVNGEQRVGAPAILACHIRALREGRNILDPDYLSAMTLTDMEAYYRDERTGRVTLQFIPERLAKFREIGRVLRERYGGTFLSLLEGAKGFVYREDSLGIAQQLLTHFPLSYGDWPFCKLIMVALGHLYHERDPLFPRGSRYRALVDLHDPQSLEVGADYYRPFFLYRVGVLRISDDFRGRLTSQHLIDRDSPIEREYRAWTIMATRALADQLGVLPHELAQELWAMAFMRCRPCYIGVAEDEVPCSYRRVCHSYNEEPGLMQARWPLVLTSWY